ncbi:MAG: glycoside hydrolase family 3 protein, partial [Spirochaetia bacterium]|nr:glycoside hydrolase family 3 protein [Spirochaetia bacterium]
MAVYWVQRMVKKIVQKRMMKMLLPRNVIKDEQPMLLNISNIEGKRIAEALLSALTLEEKISLLSGVDEFCIRSIERVGLKQVWCSDASMGLRGWNADVTDFPASLAMAATFDTGLLAKVGDVLGQECRALGIGILLGPGVNIARVPVCGRNFEYFGEDPYLAGELAASYIQGVQKYPVITTVKHFACNNSEYDRHKSNSIVDERTLHELYLPAFKRAVESGSFAVMTSYNQINGIYASEHSYLLDGVLRGEWQFEDLVISDWNSLYSTDKVLSCGVDLEMPGAKYLSKQKVLDALQSNVVDQDAIDRKILHLFNAYEKAGLFFHSLSDSAYQAGSEEHRQVALEVALSSVVLLKNDGQVLPLKKDAKLCLGGSNASKAAQGGGSSMIQIRKRVQSLASLLQNNATMLPKYWYRSRAWQKKVIQADAVVLVVGFDNIEESEAYDRPWTLQKSEIQSIKTAGILNNNTIVVVQSGGAVEMDSWHDYVKGILWSSYLGSSTAVALQAVLQGKANPSGKLPFTWAKNISDYRSMRQYPKDFDVLNLDRLRKGQGNPKVRKVSKLSYTEGLMVG